VGNEHVSRAYFGMEMLRKGPPSAGRGSATVGRVGRRVARTGAVLLLVFAGLASSLLVARASVGGTATTTTEAATTTVSTAPAVLVVTGHGYGHGLGMSQWGAYGYARHGFDYGRILAHYYRGTTLTHAGGRTLRVLLVQSKSVSLGSAGAWSVTDAAGRRVALDPGTLALGGALELDAHPELSPPFSFTSPAPMTVDGHAYRGKLLVSSDGKLVTVVNGVGLEQYLKGVVPSEMPSTWPAAALQAQAVAARSYALANLVKSGPFDLYSDSRSQAYGGVGVESPPTSAAVDTTAGLVLDYDGKVADTLFHASSGGRTVSSVEATGVAVPYLVSVPDPYDTYSPEHDWGPLLFDAAKLQAVLKLPAAITAATVVDGTSGRVKSLAVSTDDGPPMSFTGSQLRLALALRSTWFAPVLLRLQTSIRTVAYGTAATLEGDAADGVTLEALPAGTRNWAWAGAPTAAADGSFSLSVKPRLTTAYRLAYRSARAGLVTVSVAPRVVAAASAGSVAGTATPAAAGGRVQLLRREGSAWTAVSATATDAAGAFGFGGTLAAGTYRVRVTPGHGLVAGLSAALTLP
jgi:stage II sporulation protein D